MEQQELQSFIKGLCGYEIGQKVYWRKLNVAKGTCGICGGTHAMTATAFDGEEIRMDCPFCNEAGETDAATYYTAEPDEIRSVYITATNSHPERVYGEVEVKVEPIFYLLNRSLELRVKDIYLTEEEAMSGVKKENFSESENTEEQIRNYIKSQKEK